MSLQTSLNRHPRVRMGHLPTPLEPMPNLSLDLGIDLWIKRDDCTGVGLGGNKVRQLEYYLGKAAQQNATQVLITGAVQSNFTRTTAAMAAKLGMGCHIQLEERVANTSDLYRNNGNVLLDKLFGAVMHSYPDGEDEAGADANLQAIANDLTTRGEVPFIIPLSADRPPTGALGYVDAALEIDQQETDFAAIFIASGSALTHCGLLFGLRAIGNTVPVIGVCVRRSAHEQTERVTQRLDDLAQLLQMPNPVQASDIQIDDSALAPGYGKMGATTHHALIQTARREGVLLDPVYTAKVMAALMSSANGLAGKRVLFWHTGGQPAVFAYAEKLADEA